MTKASTILTDSAQRVEDYLRQRLARCTPSPPARLREAMEYSLLAGGKRLRPALVLECARLGKANPQQAQADALPAAAAIEVIHTFSLVHDDLPAMDDDDLRRGRPTSHKVFGEAMAILAGDAMIALAFEVLAGETDPALAPRLVVELARATGPGGMIGGQVLDIDSEKQQLDLQQLQQLHAMKTGALLVAACRMGAICARADERTLDAITRFGQHLGLAFQIVDDVLDETSTPEQLGKMTKKDAGKGKNTYPRLLGLEESRNRANQELDRALNALNGLGNTDRLSSLASFVVQRDW